MSLLQQPFQAVSHFKIPFSYYVTPVSGSFSGQINFGNTKAFNNEFCSYNSGRIEITSNGYFQVNMDFLTKTRLVASTGSFQFRLEMGTTIVAQSFIQTSSGSTVSNTNDFSLQDYPYLIDASTIGNLAYTFSNSGGIIQYNGLASFVSQKYFLTSGEYVRLYLVYNGVSGSPTNILLNGNIALNKVS